MALTATAQAFGVKGHTTPEEILWVPSDPGDTFTEGDLVTFTVGEGIADPCGANEAGYGVVRTTVVSPAATTAGFPAFGPGAARGWGQVPDDVLKTLVEIQVIIPAGMPIVHGTFASHQDDENIVAYTAGTPSIETTTAAQDDANGALLYVYGGPGVGQWNVIADVDGSNVMTLHRKFETALTTASDIIWLAGEAADAKGVGFFGRTGTGDQNNLVVNQHADDGLFTVYLDARDVALHLHNLRLPVIPSAAFLLV